jgi:hypothetical protein
MRVAQFGIVQLLKFTKFHEYFTRVYGQFIEFGNGITITSDSLTRMNSTRDYHALAPSAVADCNLENPALKDMKSGQEEALGDVLRQAAPKRHCQN